MSLSSHAPSVDIAQLRALAAGRLSEAASCGTRTVLGIDAMSARMELATMPAHAAQALALQQELAIHRIEIDALFDELNGRS